MKNTGGVAIGQNTVNGNLQCKENAPAPTGGRNVVQGSKEDQCASLATGTHAAAAAAVGRWRDALRPPIPAASSAPSRSATTSRSRRRQLRHGRHAGRGQHQAQPRLEPRRGDVFVDGNIQAQEAFALLVVGSDVGVASSSSRAAAPACRAPMSRATCSSCRTAARSSPATTGSTAISRPSRTAAAGHQVRRQPDRRQHAVQGEQPGPGRRRQHRGRQREDQCRNLWNGPRTGSRTGAYSLSTRYCPSVIV